MTVLSRNGAAISVYPTALAVSTGDSFDIDFEFGNNPTYIKSFIRTLAGEIIELSLYSDYDVTISENPGYNNSWGTLTLKNDYQNCSAICIYRQIENSQDVAFSSQTIFADTTEDALDKLTMLVQDEDYGARAITAPKDDLLNPADMELPNREIRANSVIVFNDTGNVSTRPIAEAFVDVVDNLDSTDPDKALSANMGHELNSTITSIVGDVSDLDIKVSEIETKTTAIESSISALETKTDATNTKVENLDNQKQDKLIAGDGITISDDNVISSGAKIGQYWYRQSYWLGIIDGVTLRGKEPPKYQVLTFQDKYVIINYTESAFFIFYASTPFGIYTDGINNDFTPPSSGILKGNLATVTNHAIYLLGDQKIYQIKNLVAGTPEDIWPTLQSKDPSLQNSHIMAIVGAGDYLIIFLDSKSIIRVDKTLQATPIGTVTVNYDSDFNNSFVCYDQSSNSCYYAASEWLHRLELNAPYLSSSFRDSDLIHLNNMMFDNDIGFFDNGTFRHAVYYWKKHDHFSTSLFAGNDVCFFCYQGSFLIHNISSYTINFNSDVEITYCSIPTQAPLAENTIYTKDEIFFFANRTPSAPAGKIVGYSIIKVPML